MKELILSLENGEITLEQFVELMAAMTAPKFQRLTAQSNPCRGECAL